MAKYSVGQRVRVNDDTHRMHGAEGVIIGIYPQEEDGTVLADVKYSGYGTIVDAHALPQLTRLDSVVTVTPNMGSQSDDNPGGATWRQRIGAALGSRPGTLLPTLDEAVDMIEKLVQEAQQL